MIKMVKALKMTNVIIMTKQLSDAVNPWHYMN